MPKLSKTIDIDIDREKIKESIDFVKTKYQFSESQIMSEIEKVEKMF